MSIPSCEICGAPLSWNHDHRDDFIGLDDGPYRERKRSVPKSAEQVREVRLKAWNTRRAKYGVNGHSNGAYHKTREPV